LFHFNLLVCISEKQRIVNTLTLSSNVFHLLLVGMKQTLSRNFAPVRDNSLILRPAASRHSSKRNSVGIRQPSEMTTLSKVGLWPGTPENRTARRGF
jgi:hypothetical protein